MNQPSSVLALMPVFDFDASDLEANRAGNITERQIENLKRLRWKRIKFWGLWTVGCLLLLAYYWPGESPDKFVFLLILFIVVMVQIGLLNEVRQVQADLKAGIASGETGHPILAKHESYRGNSYQLIMLHVTFDVSKQQYEDAKPFFSELSRKAEMKVYYSAQAKVLLSMEG